MGVAVGIGVSVDGMDVGINVGVGSGTGAEELQDPRRIIMKIVTRMNPNDFIFPPCKSLDFFIIKFISFAKNAKKIRLVFSLVL